MVTGLRSQKWIQSPFAKNKSIFYLLKEQKKNCHHALNSKKEASRGNPGILLISPCPIPFLSQDPRFLHLATTTARHHGTSEHPMLSLAASLPP